MSYDPARRRTTGRPNQMPFKCHPFSSGMTNKRSWSWKGRLRPQGPSTAPAEIELIDEITGFGRLKLLDEETLRTVGKETVREGSPGDDNFRCVFQVASDENSCIASTKRAFEEETGKSRSEQGAASSSQWTGTGDSSKHWSSGWWGGSWNTQTSCLSWNDSPCSRWKEHERGANNAWQEGNEEGNEEEGTENIFPVQSSKKLEESYQAKAMEVGVARSLQVRR